MAPPQAFSRELRTQVADAARGRPWRTVVPSAPVRIAGLVSPLRYDILVRARFLHLLAEQHDRFRADPAVLHAAAREHAYHVWFRELWCVHWAPALLRDPAALDRAFARRVDATFALFDSFRTHGFDTAQPITLYAGSIVAPTHTGRRVARRLYAGDGCHRLALLMLSGAREVPPGAYRIRHHLRLQPGDTTDLLVRALAVPPEEHRAFLAWGDADLDPTPRIRRHQQ